MLTAYNIYAYCIYLFGVSETPRLNEIAKTAIKLSDIHSCYLFILMSSILMSIKTSILYTAWVLMRTDEHIKNLKEKIGTF